jgi:hypothetical protein
MIIHLGKLKNGRRILLEVSELINKNEFIGNNTVLEVKDIFKYRTEDTGINDNEHNESCRGDIVYTGYTPTFMDKIKSRGLNFNYKDENLG